MSLDATGPNAEQIRYWNETAGPKWVALQDLLDAQIGELGVAAIDAAGIAPAHDVIDIGCGCGQSTLEIARRVGPDGTVLGVDISAPMLERASEQAVREHLTQASFRNVDAQTHSFAPASVDHVFSRFGVMFFADPPAAFANLRNALRPSGNLTFLCWQPITENPWMLTPLLAAADHIPLPQPPAPGAPGPFAFANPDFVRGILERAGFAEIAFDALRRSVIVGGGGDVDQAVDFVLQMGPTGAALRDAGADTLPRVRDSVRAALEPFATEDGIRMDAAAWIVSARPSA